jgi:hypothetical protein
MTEDNDLAEQQAEARARAAEELGPQNPPYDPDTVSPDPPTIPEIGGDFSGVIGPDFGPWPPVGEYTPPPPAGDAAGDGDGIANEYGDGPDLDGNGIPDEIGINPDNQQPGYRVTATQPTDADTPPAPPSGEGEYQDQDVPPLQFGNTGNFNNTAPSDEEEEYEEQDVPPLQFGNTANLTNRLDPNAPYEPANPETLEYRDPYAVTTDGTTNSTYPGAPEGAVWNTNVGEDLAFPGPAVPEIGADFSGVRGPDWGLWPPDGEDTPPPPGEPGETPPQQPDQSIEFAPDTASDDPGGAEQQTQGIDPNLLDSTAPGPTLDTGLVERIEQIPGLVDRVNQDSFVAEALERDPTQIEQIEQDLGFADQKRPMEPSGDSSPSFTDSSFTDAGTAGQDVHGENDDFSEGGA